MAAAYAYGTARNHPLIDGNERTSLLALYTFLGINGVSFIVPEADAAAIILALAAGEVSEASPTRRIRDNWPKVPAANRHQSARGSLAKEKSRSGRPRR